MSKQIKFEDALSPTDFGFIVCGKTGILKGLWIPNGMDQEVVPDPIVKICKEMFGVDPNDNEHAPILH